MNFSLSLENKFLNENNYYFNTKHFLLYTNIRFSFFFKRNSSLLKEREMQESNIYSIWFSILSSPFHFVFGNLSFAWTVYNNVFSVISPSLLLFQIDDRKDVCLVAVAPPIEKWLSFFFSQLLTYQQFNFVLFFVWWFSSPSFIYY